MHHEPVLSLDNVTKSVDLKLTNPRCGRRATARTCFFRSPRKAHANAAGLTLRACAFSGRDKARKGLESTGSGVHSCCTELGAHFE